MGKKIDIMIVDDAMYMRAILKKILEGAGYNVVAEAEDGDSAVKTFRIFMPDIITMDINMPSMSGLDALRSIMKIKPDTKVVMVSAAGQKNNVISSIARGAKGFIVKPFHKDKVLEVIEQLVAGNKDALDISEDVQENSEIELSYKEIMSRFVEKTEIEQDEAKIMIDKFLNSAKQGINEIETNINADSVS